MFSIRPDQRWPWIRFEPPSEDSPGLRMAPDGSIRATGDSGPVFPGEGSGTISSAPFDIEFGNAYRAASSSFDGQSNGAGRIPSFGSGSLPPFATSLLFPRLTEPQTMWPGPQGHVGEPEARPDTRCPDSTTSSRRRTIHRAFALPPMVQCAVDRQTIPISGHWDTILTLTSRCRQASIPMRFIPSRTAAIRSICLAGND